MSSFLGLLARFVEFSLAIEGAFEHSRHNIHGICLRRILVNLSTNHTEIHAQHVWLVYKCSEFYACLTCVFAQCYDRWILNILQVFRQNPNVDISKLENKTDNKLGEFLETLDK